MGLITTAVSELMQHIGVVQSANIDKLKANINFSKRKIAALQRILVNLKSSEMLILQRMNRTMKMEDVQKYLSSDRYISQNPLPSIKPYDVTGPDPDPRINYARRHLEEGMESMKAEVNRIDNEVLDISQQIQKQQAILNANQESLNKLPNSSSSIELDNIAKRQYSELYMLYEVHKKYRYLSFSTETNSRSYSYDPKIISQYNTLKIAFRAYAARNSFVLSGKLKLDFTDPGSDDNETSLKIFLDQSRQVLEFNQQGGLTASNQFTQEVEKYSKMMMGNVNDSYTSQNLSRQLDSKRVPNDPLSGVTTSIENINKFMGNYYNLLSFPSFSTAVKKFFHNKLVGLYDGMPLCDPDPDTDEDKQKKKDQEAQAKAESDASNRYIAQFEKAKDKTSPEQVTSYINGQLFQIDTAISSTTGKDIPDQATLNIVINSTESRIYTSTNLYQRRVLDLCRNLLDYMLTEFNNGKLTEENYKNYLDQIVSDLDKAGVPYTVQH